MLNLKYALLIGLFSVSVQAAPRIAVLDFELKDLTLAPGIPAEIERTAAIKPLLESALRSAGYEIVQISPEAQQAANSGEGYLFDHADVAAELGKRAGSDFVVVGRLHKPSYLFAYLMANLVRVGDTHWMSRVITESKGPSLELIGKAVETLADKIDNQLEDRYSPPPPRPAKTQHP